jgi:biopolymer transport protein TolR
MARHDHPSDFPIGPPHARRRRRHKIHHRPKSAITVGATRADINVTPLVDVVLVLLIIFMVVTPMLHRGVHIELPQTAHHDKKQDTGEQLIVSVRQDGVYLETERVLDAPQVGKKGAATGSELNEKDLGALHARLRKDMRDGARPVFVRADRSLKYGQVRFVLERIHNAGASVVSVQTDEKK